MADVRIPPQDLDTERALLGAIMLNPSAMYEIADILSAESFYAAKHKTIYEAMLSLFARGEPVDLVSLSARLKEKKALDKVGGNTYLSELVGVTVSPSSARHYAEVIQAKGILRSLIMTGDEIAQLGFQEERAIEEVLNDAQARIFRIANTAATRKFTDLRTELRETWERVERLSQSKGELRGVPTGFKALDNKLAGLQKADLIILAARPSMGKTSLALDIARRAAVEHKVPIGVFSLEMSAQQLTERMLAATSYVDAWKLRTGRGLTERDYENLQHAIGVLDEAPIYIDDTASNTVLAMRSTARRLKAEKGLGLVVIDYLQLAMPTSTRANDSMVQQVTEISRGLKAMARELNVPVLALSQLSREVEKRGGRPKLSDLRESGCLAGDTIIVNARTGERRTIRELADMKTSMPVFAIDEQFRVRCVPATRFFSSGVKRLYTLKTRSGRSIRASANHPFRTIEGWKHLDELRIGACIAVPRALTPLKVASPLSHDELMFLAHLIGDGCILPKQPYHYTTASVENRTTVEHASARLFGITPRIVRQKNWWHVYFSSPYRLTRGKRHPISLWFERLGIERVRSYEKRIPEAVFQCSDPEIALFLKHLWSTDGNVSVKRIKGRKNSAAIYYASSSRMLADQVAHLLLRLSIHAVVRTQKSSHGYRNMYHVHIEGAPMQMRFLTIVGIADERAALVPTLISALERITPNTNIDVTPKEAWHLIIDPAKKAAGMSWRDVSRELGMSYCGSTLFRSGIGRDRLSLIATILKSPLCMELATAQILWDPIVAITDGGEEEVFDATVPHLHNFVADDIVVHNSIEQDADVVLFIHREDKDKRYQDAGEVDNGFSNDFKKEFVDVEVIIAKHRNGPVGAIKLHFKEDQTRFESISEESVGALADGIDTEIEGDLD